MEYRNIQGGRDYVQGYLVFDYSATLFQKRESQKFEIVGRSEQSDLLHVSFHSIPMSEVATFAPTYGLSFSMTAKRVYPRSECLCLTVSHFI